MLGRLWFGKTSKKILFEVWTNETSLLSFGVALRPVSILLNILSFWCLLTVFKSHIFKILVVFDFFFQVIVKLHYIQIIWISLLQTRGS